MQLNEGWLVGARRVPRRTMTAVRMKRPLPYWWCITLACHRGNLVVRGLMRCSLVPDPHAHPFFAEIAHLRVSAHCLIRRDGEIVQYVPFDKRAWHAGVSCYQGRERCNDFSIGIELEGTDTLAYTDAQYRQLAAVTDLLIALYPAIAENIAGHSDIAPVRKTDPGPAFDWIKYRALLSAPSEKETS